MNFGGFRSPGSADTRASAPYTSLTLPVTICDRFPASSRRFHSHRSKSPQKKSPKISSHTPSMGRTTPPHRPLPAAAPVQNFPATPDKVVEFDLPELVDATSAGFRLALVMVGTHTIRFFEVCESEHPSFLISSLDIFGRHRFRGFAVLRGVFHWKAWL